MLVTFQSWPLVIQVHTIAALIALVIGPFAIWRKRKDTVHRALGATWIVLMLVVATSAWFIHGVQLIGPFSPIHLFSLLVYRSVYLGLRHVRAGRYREHGAEMRSLYLQALCITGILTLLPGRSMQQMIFGTNMVLTFAVMAALAAALALLWWRKPQLDFCLLYTSPSPRDA